MTVEKDFIGDLPLIKNVNLKYLKMKFVHYLEKITDVSVYPVISFCIFGLFFIAVATWVFKSDKKQMESNSRLPLD
ncbi:MAG TPA: hypothetical protein VFN30_12530 [Chitinophagaceae bacterium]|nr:hypothetical protein [Chitinophagaceae bacterium]